MEVRLAGGQYTVAGHSLLLQVLCCVFIRVIFEVSELVSQAHRVRSLSSLVCRPEAHHDYCHMSGDVEYKGRVIGGRLRVNGAAKNTWGDFQPRSPLHKPSCRPRFLVSQEIDDVASTCLLLSGGGFCRVVMDFVGWWILSGGGCNRTVVSKKLCSPRHISCQAETAGLSVFKL